MTLAMIFRRFDLKLYETTREDVDAAHDFMVPSPRLDSKGHAGAGESIIAPIENRDIGSQFRNGKAESSRMLPSPFTVRLQGFCERIAKMNVFLMPRIEDFIDRHLL